MNRRKMFSLIASSLCLGATLFSGGMANATQSDEVKAAIDEFHAALESRDIKKMEAVLAHDDYAMLVNPRDKSTTVGWDNVRKSWESTFNFWAELKLQMTGAPHIHINGDVAWADSSVTVVGKTTAGANINGPTLEAYVFEKHGKQWLLVSHNAWRVPQ